MLTGGRAWALAVLLLAVSCGSDPEPAVRTGPDVPPPVPPGRVAERWEPVTHLEGTGRGQPAAFEISGQAIEWRVTASCQKGSLEVRLAPDPKPLVTQECPKRGFGFSIKTGPAVLDVVATGPWEIAVDQKVDTPISEPPLAGMVESARLAGGTFYGIDQTGQGAVTLYRLPDGRRALRLDPFHVTANTDLYVWLSAAEKPTTSKAAFTSDHVQIHELKATAGPQNYLVPDHVTAEAMRSVVIWCEPVRTAYAAAALSG